MTMSPHLPGRLRGWFGTLAFASLVVAGVAYGATIVVRIGLEREAVADAGTLANSIVAPALRPADLDAPIRGERYQSLLSTMRRRVLKPPVTSIEIWKPDGTIVFADRRSLLGQRVPSMRASLHDAHVRGSLRLTEGDTFRALIGVAVGDASAVVEVDRPASGIAEQAGRWRPWVPRGLRAAAAFLVLYGLSVAASLFTRRRRARDAVRLPTRKGGTPSASPVEDSRLNVRRRRSDRQPTDRSAPTDPPGPPGSRGGPGPPGPPGSTVPAYMQPGFREHLEARREAEDALTSARQALSASESERQRLRERLEQIESELEEARRRAADHRATTGG
jgi:hypothetical protein